MVCPAMVCPDSLSFLSLTRPFLPNDFCQVVFPLYGLEIFHTSLGSVQVTPRFNIILPISLMCDFSGIISTLQSGSAFLSFRVLSLFVILQSWLPL